MSDVLAKTGTENDTNSKLNLKARKTKTAIKKDKPKTKETTSKRGRKTNEDAKKTSLKQ